MGTVATFAVHTGAVASGPPSGGPSPGDEGAVRAAVGAACAELHRLDDLFSTWKPDSPLSRWRRGQLGTEALPAEITEVLELCREAVTLSAGWFDPWAMPGGVDPTGLVKGWAVQRAAALVEAAGVAGAMVNAGGDLVTFGRPLPDESWRIGIRHPWRPDAVAGIITTTGAVATSGVYERGAHLVDPHTGLPRCAVASATVTGPGLALADALATALAVAGEGLLPVIEGIDGYEAYVIGRDGDETATPGFTLSP